MINLHNLLTTQRSTHTVRFHSVTIHFLLHESLEDDDEKDTGEDALRLYGCDRDREDGFNKRIRLWSGIAPSSTPPEEMDDRRKLLITLVKLCEFTNPITEGGVKSAEPSDLKLE